ncbi:ABC transporter permease [Aestuariivita sp.]|jgi:putative spermidine/putrescine transport system permease protein|uniref:ABC transporter permease n=1 Tax=Aestuariivita sp. TaxID=1872407 RepID=UPI0021729191|nr:ABC transporter permease [Aestuariivita sp.]MCE8006926.1 ABC transporter permease [Aestuariivita sp.]
MTTLRPSVIATLIAALVGVFLMLPLLAVVPVSFTPKRFLSLPTDEWSLRHYWALIENPVWASGVWLSIRIGLISASVATLLGLFFSLGIWMVRPKFSGALMGIALLPMVAPPVVSALTLYFFLIKLSGFNDLVAYDTLLGVALVHAVMITPFAVVLTSVSLSQVDRRIDLAARAMGASLFDRVFKVILPNIRFGIVVSFLLTFILSWEEIAVTIFVTSVEAVTLPRLMWMGLRDNIDPAIAALSVVLTVLVVSIALVRTLYMAFASKS